MWLLSNLLALNQLNLRHNIRLWLLGTETSIWCMLTHLSHLLLLLLLLNHHLLLLLHLVLNHLLLLRRHLGNLLWRILRHNLSLWLSKKLLLVRRRNIPWTSELHHLNALLHSRSSWCSLRLHRGNSHGEGCHLMNSAWRIWWCCSLRTIIVRLRLIRNWGVNLFNFTQRSPSFWFRSRRGTTSRHTGLSLNRQNRVDSLKRCNRLATIRSKALSCRIGRVYCLLLLQRQLLVPPFTHHLHSLCKLLRLLIFLILSAFSMSSRIRWFGVQMSLR